MRRAAALLPVLAVAGLAGCGGGGGADTATEAAPAAAGGAGGAVEIVDFSYKPADLTVAKGTTVEFTNEDSTAHTATAKGGAFDSGTIQPGKSSQVTLDQTGTFTYTCSFHPFMKGTVTVE
jgi:plastocyanin